MFLSLFGLLWVDVERVPTEEHFVLEGCSLLFEGDGLLGGEGRGFAGGVFGVGVDRWKRGGQSTGSQLFFGHLSHDGVEIGEDGDFLRSVLHFAERHIALQLQTVLPIPILLSLERPRKHFDHRLHTDFRVRRDISSFRLGSFWERQLIPEGKRLHLVLPLDVR